MTLTWTLAARFSQTRGGENITLGPISRRFSCTVSGSSGKFTVKPTSSALATPIICSPIQGSGRKERNSSSGCLGSTAIRLAAIESMLVCVSSEPFGKPVVPEV